MGEYRLFGEGTAKDGSRSSYMDAVTLVARDEADRTRAVAPLRPAPDAVIVDNTDMDAEAMFNLSYSQVKDAVS